ncbi:MAG TPA: flavin reductase family protein [Streptosporangiaceae bacterium]|nr:flavin reductase family protein [Streptosporangiaceae bacterium]
MTAAPDVSRPWFEPEPRRFRQVLGHFCSGVTVITTADDDGPAGFACQSFAAVSLDPPLVLFCPSRASVTWPRIERAGHFCANVLAAGQRELARVFAVSGATGTDKFAGVPWSRAPSGAPILDGVLTWAGCTIGAVHEAGDHHLVIGRVTDLGECVAGPPLLFYRGRYGMTAAQPEEGPPEIVDTLLAWPRHADWM